LTSQQEQKQFQLGPRAHVNPAQSHSFQEKHFFSADGNRMIGAFWREPMSHSSVCRVLRFCVYFQLLFVVSAQAKRHDLVIMKNGDHLTGEVKRLENGTLYVDLDYVSGSVGLDWRQVDKVQSTATYQIVLNNGNHVAGNIEKAPATETPGNDFEITNAASVVRAASSDVAQIESQKQNFWRQLKGGIDFGYDFTSGNSQTALSSDANAAYLSTHWEAGASFTSSFSGQSGASKTNLLELQMTAARFLNKNSFILSLGDFLHSSQQDLSLRTTIGGGYGRYWIRTNKSLLRWITGAVYTHENFQSASSQPVAENIEALLGAQYQTFQFDRYNLHSQVLVYPGLSDAGRIRTTTKTTFTVKLTNNFHSDISFWDNFDSSPPINSKRNELGLSSSLGWSF
jgi:putative salt-induced outer membrane protein YdiY